MPAIEVEALEVSFGSVTAVDGVTFSGEAGEVLALIGPNGAGKTTTVETLEGYRRPTRGTVRVLGLDPVADHHALVPSIGVMLQQGGTYPVMSPERAIRLFASYYDDPRDPDELLDLAGLREVAKRPAKRLSGGERQRLSLALALVGRPRVAFLDEPTAGVDPAGRIVVREIVAALRDGGACVLLTTHELAEAERLADRVVIVDRGRVVAAGRPAELVTTGEEIRFAAPTGIDVVALGTALGASVVEVGPGEYQVAVAATPAAVAALTAWLAAEDLPLADLRAGRQSLEDAFLRLTSRDAHHEPEPPR
ncbi:MAG: transporter [Acidimicrobiaceae bacterium]|jgi:ABC-2 type transport system ATP-binding protein|nr:transporter [Acidimicrobiaceae bacterium]